MERTHSLVRRSTPIIAHANRDVLQLRQAKLSFPSVYLLVGVFSDELCHEHGAPTQLPHEDRCEVVRHCRWADEVVPDAPWTLHEKFLRARQIDFVAIDEGTSIDPDCDRDRLKGYDLVKSLREWRMTLSPKGDGGDNLFRR